MDADTTHTWIIQDHEQRYFNQNGVSLYFGDKSSVISDSFEENHFKLIEHLRSFDKINKQNVNPNQEGEDDSPELTDEDLNELLKSIGLNQPQRATMSEVVNTLAGEGTMEVYYLDTEKALAFRNSNNDVIRIFGETENSPLEIHIDLYRTDHFSNLLINSRLSVAGNLEGVAFVSYADMSKVIKESFKLKLSEQAVQLIDLVFSQ